MQMMSIRALLARIPVEPTSRQFLCVQKAAAMANRRPVSFIQLRAPAAEGGIHDSE